MLSPEMREHINRLIAQKPSRNIEVKDEPAAPAYIAPAPVHTLPVQTVKAKNFDEQTIQEAFLEFHGRHPEVYAYLVAAARRIKEKRPDIEQIGIAIIWENMRYNLTLETKNSGEEYSLPNDYRSRYSRLIMEQEPDLVGYFKTRMLKTA